MADCTTGLLPLGPVASNTRWFSSHGGVVVQPDGRRDVVIGGTLVGSFSDDDLPARDVLLAALGGDPHVHLGRLGDAFELSREMVRMIRRKFEAEGLAGLLNRRASGRPEKVDERRRARLHALFAKGLSVSEAHARVATSRRLVSRSTVGRERQAWQAVQASTGIVSGDVGSVSEQLVLTVARVEVGDSDASPPSSPEVEGSMREEIEPTDIDVCNATHVQHVGAWILVAMVAQLGLHASAIEAAEKRVDARRLRMAIDATLIALAIGEPTVEGVRRLATTTAPILLRTSHAPTPSWIRRILGRLSKDTGATLLHWRMLQRYLASAKADEARPAVFYVDNHMRPYTGRAVIRRGWRMQDKRARPGITDYYIHDEDGRPLWREPVADHASLTAKLHSIAMHLHLGTGDDEPRVLLAFDRAGAFPEAMIDLRDCDTDFVTYERRPYALYTPARFDQVATIDGETVTFHESRTNLGKGRGRVRRIAIRTDDGRQVNLLAASKLPAADLIAILFHRWRQENGFKHGAERWGINQLDGRKTEPYPADTIVPNPGRRRLDRAIRLLGAREGQLRCALADTADDARRDEIRTAIADVATERDELLALRPTMPKRAPLVETDLAGKLVQHAPDYKTTLDSLRIACANVEADLATMLAPRLPKPAEAKKLLAAVFRAPGSVRVGSRTIGVKLDVAANDVERDALDAVCRQLDLLGLTLPGDSQGRTLRFRLRVG